MRIVLSLLAATMVVASPVLATAQDYGHDRDSWRPHDDYGRDVVSVETLQRQHEGVLRDFGNLEDKVRSLNRESKRLIRAHANRADTIKDFQNDL